MVNGGQSTSTAPQSSTPVAARAATTAQTESKRDLTSWWKTFKRGNNRPVEERGTVSRDTISLSQKDAPASAARTAGPLHAANGRWSGGAAILNNGRSADDFSVGSANKVAHRLKDPVDATHISGLANVSDHTATAGIFGIPLQQSIRYANVAISLFNDDGQSYIYGYVPIVVAKCGVFLKEKGALEISVSSYSD